MQGRNQSRTHLALQYICDAKKQSMQGAGKALLTAQVELPGGSNLMQILLKMHIAACPAQVHGTEAYSAHLNTAGFLIEQ